MIERRRRQRFVERNDVLIRTPADKFQGAGVAAHTFDLSTGGARIIASKEYSVGSPLRLRLNLAGTDQSVNLEGDVRWSRPAKDEGHYEIGIEFKSLTSQAVLTLIRHLYGRNEGIPTTVV
jgi:Tfp pilus assembly protein PilZ